MKQQTALAVRILNFVAPYLPAHILEEAKDIIQNTGKTWSDTERLVVDDILRHLETEGYNGWLPILKEICEQAGMKLI